MENEIAYQMRVFRDKFPETEGWSCTIHQGMINSAMSKLPAFVRAMDDAEFEGDGERILTGLLVLGPKDIRSRLRSVPLKKKGRGLGEFEWSGEISFRLGKDSFRVRRFLVQEPPAYRRKTLIAAHSLEAVERLWERIEKFDKKKINLKKTVYVVNGPDYPRPKQKWSDVVLPDSMKSQIRESFESFLTGKAYYRELGLPYRRGFLFTGPPGNGKTLITKVIAGEYDINIVTAEIRANFSEQMLSQAFQMASNHSPCVLILEDVDRMVNHRSISMSYFLNRLDGLNTAEGILLIATSNHPEFLDSALLHRPSRFDRVWRFTLPTQDERLQLLCLRGGKYFEEKALADAAHRSGGFSMAYVQEIVVNALMKAAHKRETPVEKHLIESLSELREQIKGASAIDKPIDRSNSVGFSST